MLFRSMPGMKFEAAAAGPARAAMMRRMAEGFPVKVLEGQAHSLMQRAAAGLVCSGTATLEAAFFGLPYALVYKTAWLTFEVGKRVVDVNALGIVNILNNYLVNPPPDPRLPAVAAKVEENGNRPSVVVVELSGATTVHGSLTSEEFYDSLSDACEDFIGHGQVVKVIDRTRKLVDPDEVRRSNSVAAEAMQALEARRVDSAAPVIGTANAPKDVKKFVESGVDRDEVLTRAEQVLIDRLWGAH